MVSSASPPAFFGTRKWRFSLITELVLIVGAGILTVLLVQQGSAQNASVEKSWPSFTMQFVEKQFDASTGKVVVDQTLHLVVVDDYTCRADVIADALQPQQVGTFITVKNKCVLHIRCGRAHIYNATSRRQYSRRHHPRSLSGYLQPYCRRRGERLELYSDTAACCRR
jgi:hypothetical protein